MGKITTVLKSQSLADICIQELGGLSAWFALAWANDKSITDPLTAGEQLTSKGVVVADADIVDFYAARQIKPATALTATPLTALEGIGYWRIGSDFKIQA